MTNVVDNLSCLRKKVYEAEKKAMRKQGTVDLMAVSKTFGQNDIRPLLKENQRLFGENRIQEAKTKWPMLRQEYHDIKLHLIGPLQSNKAAEAVTFFDVIETIDREKIAAALANEMQKQNKMLPCYVQINTGLEPQKAGIDPRQAVQFIKLCRHTYELNIVGLMCIPPFDENPGPHFALLQKLAHQCQLEHLSMGMSHDYETAIAFGATIVRVGSGIFGHRTF